MQNIKRTILQDLLWALAFAGAAAAFLRLSAGLGATTGLNDANAWGIWIAFKLVFVALAGGGFTLAALVYIFHLEILRPILRRAIMLAFLGYGSFIVSLVFDLGLPWHIVMPVIHWQPHSVMFEIAWCVMLYFTVLILEFSPVVMEHPLLSRPPFQFVIHLLHKLTVPTVIAGIVLSTLHQSSLGALFLMMPHRVHPLWYSPLVPPLFFISAIAAGTAALIVENYLAATLFNIEPNREILPVMGRISAWALWLYLFLRIGDLFRRGVLPAGLEPTWESALFLVEIVAAGLLPAIMLSFKRFRRIPKWLLTASILTVAGVVSQRLSLSMLTMWRPDGSPYRPSGLEILIALGIPSAAGLLYFWFTQNLQIAQQTIDIRGLSIHPEPFYYSYENNFRSHLWRRSGIGILAISAVFGLMSPKLGVKTPVSPSLGWNLIRIDANRSADPVVFPHSDHQERIGLPGSPVECETCHHLSLPGDQFSACSECHTDAYQPVGIFDHNLHTTVLDGNASCQECHLGEHTRASVFMSCQDCHEEYHFEPGEVPTAPAYTDAMHTLCLGCHEESASVVDRTDLADCATCHAAYDELEL